MALREHITIERSAKKFRLSRLRERFRTFLGAERGAATVFFVMSAPIWIAGLGLGIEVGSWYYFHQRIQSIADTVAYSVAGRVGTGATQSELEKIARFELERQRFDFSKGGFTLNVSSSGPVFQNGTTVDVTLTRSVHRFLTGFFTNGDFEIRVRAVAQALQATPGCVLALARDADDTLLVGSLVRGTITVSRCEVLSNSVRISFRLFSNLQTDCARTGAAFFSFRGGSFTVTCQNGPFTEAGFALDPYIDRPEPNLSHYPCTHTDTEYVWTEENSLPALQVATDGSGQRYIRFCSGGSLIVERPSAVFPGGGVGQSVLYIFDNANLTFKDNILAAIGAGSAQFYFVNGGRVSIPPTTRLTASAPSAGPRPGILFFGSRTLDPPTAAPHRISLASGSALRGAIYMPGSTVEFRTSGTLGGCLQLIANRVRLDGTWQSSSPCLTSPTLATRPIVASRVVMLTQ